MLNNQPIAIIKHTYSRNNIFSVMAGPMDVHQIDKMNWNMDMDYDMFIANVKGVPAEYIRNVSEEKHGKVDRMDNTFKCTVMPLNPPQVIKPAPLYLLRMMSYAIDAGIVIPNINEDFKGKAPDLGAFEYGTDPQFGVRKEVIKSTYVPGYVPKK